MPRPQPEFQRRAVELARGSAKPIVTGNRPSECRTEVLGSRRLVGVIVDRLTHRCRIAETKGESCGLQGPDAMGRARNRRLERPWRRAQPAHRGRGPARQRPSSF